MKSLRATRFAIFLGSGILVCAPPQQVVGALLAYEGFDYDLLGSDIIGRNGGIGFSGAWRAGGFNASLNTNYDVGDGSLEIGGLASSGNRLTSRAVSSIAGLTRDLAVPLGEPNTTRYLSFMVRPGGTLGAGQFSGFFGVLLEQLGEPEVYVGKPGGGQLNHYVIENRGGSSQAATSVPVEIDATVLLVLKSEFTSGVDTFSLFLNPPLHAEPAAADAVLTANIGSATGLTVYSTGEFSLDEIRLGESYSDVLPVPEPSTAITALVSVAIILGFRRRPFVAA